MDLLMRCYYWDIGIVWKGFFLPGSFKKGCYKLLPLLDPRPRLEGSCKIGSDRSSFRLSVSFLGIGSLVFSETYIVGLI